MWTSLQIETHGYEEIPAFQHLEHALRTSHKPEATSAFAEVHGCEMWEYFKQNPEKEKRFSKGMQSCDALGTCLCKLLTHKDTYT